MTTTNIKGVIPAVPTPVSSKGEPDTGRLIEFGSSLLAEGANALNITGTTGEATSLSREQRHQIISDLGKSSIDKSRLMVGTGAAAVADAVALSRTAADNGFAAALLLPPFYFKDPSFDGLLRYFGAVVEGTATTAIPIYLYNFPALSGVPFTPDLVSALVDRFGDRIAGLKDSSGDLDYAAAIAQQFRSLRVFPSNEGTLMEARAGEFAGTISATANLSVQSCASAFQDGDKAELEKASSIRSVVAKGPLVPRIKALIAERLNASTWANVLPPYRRLSEQEADLLYAEVKSGLG